MRTYWSWIDGRQGQPLGLAISPTRLYVAIPAHLASGGGGTATTRTWELEPVTRGDEGWPSLTAALLEFKNATALQTQALAIALLPGLVQVRRVELPKLRPEKLRMLLSRNAARYFPSVSGPQLANGVPVARSSPTPYVAATTPLRVIEAIARAVQNAGFDITTIVPAHAAWAAAAVRRWPALRRENGSVAVNVGTHIDLMQIEHGRLMGVRRPSTRGDTTADVAYDLHQPEETAAAYAASAGRPELLPDSLYLRRAQSRRRLITRGSGALAAAVLLAAATGLWQARRALQQVTQERDALRARVGHVADAEQRISTFNAALAGLKRVEVQGVLWSDVLSDVSDNLPKDAYLVSFRAHHDSVSADGIAARGTSVFERMDGAKLLDGVRSTGPIRRDAKRGTGSIDRFTIAAHVPGAVPLHTKTEEQQ